ncbi:MAG: hypothetical protein IJS61_01690 [Firmicutes bacterium]|nr:hypothetical protein [Bacillota bacterium]
MKKFTGMILSFVLLMNSGSTTIPLLAAEDEQLLGQEEVVIDDTVSPTALDLHANTYTEYIYIHNEAELKAIEGHDGGYYELAANITLSENWKPLNITNAVFDGKGHWIYGLKQTGTDAKGLFNWSVTSDSSDNGVNIYVANLNLSEIEISVSGSVENFDISALGGDGIVAENCYVSGDIEIDTDISGKGTVYGMKNCINSKSYLDIKDVSKGTGNIILYGMYDCKKCDYNGDIDTLNTCAKLNVVGINAHYSSGSVTGNYTDGYTGNTLTYGDNTFTGDINVKKAGGMTSVYGIGTNKNSKFLGDIDVNIESDKTGYSNQYIYPLISCADTVLNGDITVKCEDTSYSYNDTYFDYNGTLGCANCNIKGDIYFYTNTSNSTFKALTGYNNKAKGDIKIIYDCINIRNSYSRFYTIDGYNCYFEGSTGVYATDISTPKLGFAALSSGKKSKVKGNVYINCGTLICISGSSNGTVIGDFTVSKGDIQGISDSSNCQIYGNLTTYNGNIGGIYSRYAPSVSNCTNNYIRGNLTTINGEVKSGAYGDYGLIYQCSDSFITGTSTISKNGYTLSVTKANNSLCIGKCGHIDTMDDNICNVCNNYLNPVKLAVKYSSECEYSHSDNQGGINYIPEPDPVSYTAKVIREESMEPLAGAKVSLDGDVYTTDDKGIFTVKDGAADCVLTVSMGGDIIKKDIHFTPTDGEENIIYVRDMNIDTDILPHGDLESGTMNGPNLSVNGSSSPMFSFPSSMSLSVLENISVAYDANRKSYKAILSTCKLTADDANYVKDGGSYTPAFKKRYEAAQNLYDRARAGKLSENDFLNALKPAKRASFPGDYGFKGSGNVIAFLELQEKNGQIVVVNSGYVVSASVGVEKSAPIPPWPPITYGTFGISGTLETGLTLTLKPSPSSKPEMDISGRITGMVNPYAAAGVGVKKVASLELGLSGLLRCDVNMPFESFDKSVVATLMADYYFLGNFFVFDYKFSHTFLKWQMWPYTDPKISILPFASDDFSDMTEVDRSYLNKEEDTRENTLKSNIYPYSDVKLLKTDDGGKVLIWRDDDPNRDSLNRTALYYRVCSKDGVWSDTAQINNDGTADFEFAACSVGGIVHLVWQNANEKFTSSSIEDMLTKTDIYYSYYSASGKNWMSPVALTKDNREFEYMPRIASSGSTAYVIWNTNKQNSPFPALYNEKENVNLVSVSGGSVYKVNTSFTDVASVIDTAVDSDGNIYCAYDSDADVSTQGCVLTEKLKANGTEYTYTTDKDITCLLGIGRDLYFAEDDTIKYFSYGRTSDMVTAEKGIEGFDYTSWTSYDASTRKTVTNTAFVYEQPKDLGSELYQAGKFGTNSISKPVKIGEYDEKIRAFSITGGTDSNIDIAEIAAKIELSPIESTKDETGVSNTINQSVRLVFDSISPKEDIEAEYIYAVNDGPVAGKETFNIGVKNNGFTTLSSPNITVKDGAGSVIFSGSAQVSIAAGESEEISVNVTIPDDFTSGTVTAKVEKEGIEEENIQNNNAECKYGGADLELDMKANTLAETGKVKAVVENLGSDTAKNAVLKVVDTRGVALYDEALGEVEGNVIYTQTLGDIASGDRVKVKITLPEEYLSTEENILLTAYVTCTNEEIYKSNDIDTFRVDKSAEANILLGDVNGDNSVDSKDASIVLQHTSGIATLSGDALIAGDVNKDGSVDSKDASIILQYTSGIITQF